MAKRGRKTGSKNKKSINTRKNVHVVILIILSILSAVLIFGKTGYLGENLSPILGGIIGWIKFLIPIGVFAIAISTACDRTELASRKVIQLFVFLVCICPVIPASFVQKAIFAPLLSLFFFVKDQLTIFVWVCFLVLYSLLLSSFTNPFFTNTNPSWLL